MHRSVTAIWLLVVSACASAESATERTIPDDAALFATVDYACRNAGNVTVIQSIDRAAQTVTFDCVRP
jgi:hypothetical protein